MITVTPKVSAIAFSLLLAAALGGCGSDSDDTNSASAGDQPAAADEASGGSSSDAGGVVDPQPAGQATASVDGQEYVLDMPGALDCTIQDDTFTYSFRIGDNEVTLGAGANKYDGKWIGNIDLVVANPTGGARPDPLHPEPDRERRQWARVRWRQHVLLGSVAEATSQRRQPAATSRRRRRHDQRDLPLDPISVTHHASPGDQRGR